MSNMEWNIRSLFNPVITRLIIYGINPIDLEDVLQKIESAVLINSRSLEKKWRDLWEEKASRYLRQAEEAFASKHYNTTRELYIEAARCYFAVFLINFSDIDEKKHIYQLFAGYYHKALNLFSVPGEKVEVPIGNGRTIPAFLHLPEKTAGINGSVTVFSGLGSCKEEMHILSRTITGRGVAALVPDMPGCGESLFINDIKCRLKTIKQAISGCLAFLKNHNKTKDSVIGSTGLCMGGGYAYKAAAIHKQFSFCATLFPLFISQVKDEHTPQWMRNGEWYNYQTGGADPDVFKKEMGREPDEILSCPFFIAHGKYDNWMTIDDAMELFNITNTDNKKKVIIEDEPVFSRNKAVLHAMPVGEQMHWVRHIFADWISEKVSELK